MDKADPFRAEPVRFLKLLTSDAKAVFHPPFEDLPAMITLAAASDIVDRALIKGRALALQPLSVAVLDAAGCLVAFKREDNSSLLREKIAQAKAWGALGMGMGSRALAERAAASPAFMTALSAIAEGRVMPVPGGVLIRDGDNRIIGAVGVTGDTSDNDEACAAAGIEGVGLVADTGGTRPGG
jgi:uncharacterized protein GlcG (DUF336 family)